MKKIILISILFAILSCSEKVNDYYSGVIVDELGRPIPEVLVREDYSGNTENKCITDKNGYFKFNRSGLPEIILSKNEYLNDTLPMVWHQHGETTEFSSFITHDSTEYVLKGKNINSLKFNWQIIEKPVFDTIINFKFDKNLLFGIWLKNGDKNLEGFKILENEFYFFGYNGNRNLRYAIDNDSITLYGDNYYFNLKGVIKKFDTKNLIINWENKTTNEYKKWKNK